jgi:ABC-type polar amino acid transport system ATPase subunit
MVAMINEQQQPIIKIQGLNKCFANLHVLKGIDMEVQAGEKIVIIAPSGSGRALC